MDKETKNIVGLLVNLAFPGVGTIIWGETNTGITQLVLFVIGILLTFVLIGFPLMIGAWIWALVKGIQRLSQNK